MNDLKFAAYFGCLTATYSSTYGNLLDKSVEYGVDAAVGFSKNVLQNQTDFFVQSFMEYLKEGYTVSDSRMHALSNLFLLYGNYGECDSLGIKGTGLVKLTPASFGVN